MRKKYYPCILILLILIAFATAGKSENELTVRRIGNINPYADNAFQINSPEPGMLSITVHDNICVYRTITREIPEGETVIHWDGCGYNEEKLYEKSYTVTVELRTESGEMQSVSFQSPIDYAVQFLQYALPSSEQMYLDSPEEWFLEFRTVMKGTVRMDLIPAEGPGTVCSYSVTAAGGKILRKDFREIASRRYPEEGRYLASVYEASVPERKYEFTLEVLPRKPEDVQISVTGEIMPDRSMSEAEIWEYMMKPSVVVDIDFFRHQDVYREPDEKSGSLGTLHGQTQGLSVIRIESGWALIGAWNHEDASYVEGWVPASKLKIVYPRPEYGILIDKQNQTLSVFQNGKIIDTLLVSTGKADRNRLYQETSAGCFLTGYHRVNFSMNGKKYDYVIQYDGGNLLHQTPYDWGQLKKDFTLGRGYLGAKASHACVRIQPEPGKGGINAYWLFTHIPYHTRVIILDDAVEREATADKLQRNDKASPPSSIVHMAEPAGNAEADTVRIHFGGVVVPGGTRAFNSRRESMASLAEQNGYEIFFSKLTGIFAEDDLTCISLGGFLQGQSTDEPEQKGVRFGAHGAETMFRNTSVELVQMIHDRFDNPSDRLKRATADAVSEYADVLESENLYIISLKGHLFGFAGCNEKSYLKDPETVDRMISLLLSEGCERIVFLAEWGESGTSEHSVVQEAMARRAVRAGADLIVGSCRGGEIQGIDYICEVPVLYSLGTLLDGSVSSVKKAQYGMIASAAFSFDQDAKTPSVVLIPVKTYGESDPKKNDYMPAVSLDKDEFDVFLRSVWLDSTDYAINRTLFLIPDQS